MKKIKRTLYLVIIDVILINLAFYLALYLRFEGSIPLEYLHNYLNQIFIMTSIKIIIFYKFNLYRNLWMYASIEELIYIALATILSNIIVVSYLLIKQTYFTRSIYILVFIFDILLIGASRISYRAFIKIKSNDIKIVTNRKRVMIIGAGSAGARIIKDLRKNIQLNYLPVAIIDDDIKKQGQRINRVPVLGQRLDIANIAREKKIDEIIIAIPSASKKEIRDIAKECKKTKCKLKKLPGIAELIEGKVSINDIRNVQIEDLLGREQVELNIEEICEYIKNKTILVTGGGGSIGSELCRQISKFSPKELIVLDIYENNVYELQAELKRNHEALMLKVIIGSIRDKERINEVMESTKPDVVFHAAAHKHVPLMEENPKEAIKNNVFGTLNVAQAADRYGVNKFVMISTDKAVNPTNVMGASKRICEMLIQAMNSISKTEYVAVRFGNVLGSNGSVIPLFKKQIAEGGPVTVTHREVTRYFMTIFEATQLVLQAGAMAKGGEIFILDMGEPVKIINLAEDLIRLSGFEPYNEIQIAITGLRVGEKLFEELLLDEEGIKATTHEKIFITKPIAFDNKLLIEQLKNLDSLLMHGSYEDLKHYIAQIVPEYKIIID